MAENNDPPPLEERQDAAKKSVPAGKSTRGRARAQHIGTPTPEQQETIPLPNTMAVRTFDDNPNLELTQQRRPHVTNPVVCIGASAGGLEAMQTLISSVRPDTGCVYIVIMHLQAKSRSHLVDILRHHTSLPVHQIEHGMMLRPDMVFVIPPGFDVLIFDGHFQLKRRNQQTPQLPVDIFLRSLADVAKERAAAVILSGSGSDGSEGIRFIKDELGLVIAQSPDTARFPGMPQSAMNTGLVDFILDPQEIPAKLASYFCGPGTRITYLPPDHRSTEALHNILYQLRKQTGHNFANYKMSTLMRRVQRRIAVHQLEDLNAYLRFIQEQPQEIGMLFRELLIGVTSFFRDPSAWEVIEDKVLSSVLSGKPPGYNVRAWIAGTATGEEAYTLAIVIQEYLQRQNLDYTFQIFATDINEESIETARFGVYSANAAEDVKPELLSRYFEKENNSYRVSREIREKIIFAPQNIIKDPPFTKLDLICCRNVLIYLDSHLQHKLLPIFHYSLRPGGVLFLGTSEAVGEFTDLFQTIDARWKIFQRRDKNGPHPLMDSPFRQLDAFTRPDERRDTIPSIIQSAERSLLDFFAPPSVIVDRNGEIFYIHGRTGKFLEPAQGRARLNVLEMARDGIKNRLPGLMRKAAHQRSAATSTGIRLKSEGGSIELTITACPLFQHSNLEGLMLISFIETEKPAPGKSGGTAKDTTGYVEELEREIENISENLQTTIEELETSNEELRSVNEEYQSTNEELQSANEELETSREEMQSLNEELATVNEELQEKIEGLTQMHEHMKVYLDSLEMPTIFLDGDLCIRRFTKQATALINIMDQDVGRPLSHLATQLRTQILEDARTVSSTTTPMEKEVETEKRDWYLMRLLPYQDGGGRMDGVVMNFVPINRYKKESNA